MSLPALHVVTDSDLLLDATDFCARAAAVLARCGPDVALHLRGHTTSGRVLHAIGEVLAATALRSGAWLFVNDRVDIAMAIRARGVQLGIRSMPISDTRALLGHGAWIGYSAHAPLEAGRAAAEGADFVVVGTIFDTPSHAHDAAAGSARIAACVAATPVPVLAIGGVTRARVAEVAAAGAYGVAVLAGVWRAADPPAAAAEYIAAIQAQRQAASSHEGAV